MDSFELNKIAGAVFATILLVLGLNTLASELFHAHMPEQPGYEIEVAEGEEAGGEAEEEETIPLGVLLADASAEKGANVSKKCQACHTFDAGGANKVGPALYGVVNRPVGSHEGFNYSDAMASHGGNWTFEELNAFLENPKQHVPGTIMSFAGLKKPNDRADILLYLNQQSDSPAELPVAEAPAAEEPAADAPAEGAPAEDAPAGDAPAGDAPAMDQPAGDAPAADQPAGDAPAANQPAGDAPAADQPAGDAPAGDEPAANEPATQEPAADAPAAEEPAADSQTSDDPASDTPGEDRLPTTAN
ncbi:c-type cytochrome [Tepidamorphus sp. 3E244]|uniref:c-type cytochrome n=1 Tax=Tepidamorphus sp. 3E244 TaxID=3385498 RepID=UPI0038FD18E5